MPICFCAIGCQHSTFNRLFGCVFLVWRHHLRKVNKSSVRTFRRFFSAIFLSLMFLNIQIDWIILKTYDQQFTLTTKKSLHIIFKKMSILSLPYEESGIRITHISRSLPHKIAENSWNRYNMKKLRHCHHMYILYHFPDIVSYLWQTTNFSFSCVFGTSVEGDLIRTSTWSLVSEN